jgi:TusA-related sulfurtransferase
MSEVNENIVTETNPVSEYVAIPSAEPITAVPEEAFEPENAVVDPMTKLVEILLSNQLSQENIPNSISLNNEELSIIKELVANSPTSLKDINETFLAILSDGKISVIDIPQFIRIIKDVYVICHQSNQITLDPNALVVSMGPVVKYIVRAIISRNNIENTDLVISCCDNIIDVSVEMMQLQSNIKPLKQTCKLC